MAQTMLLRLSPIAKTTSYKILICPKSMLKQAPRKNWIKPDAPKAEEIIVWEIAFSSSWNAFSSGQKVRIIFK